MNLIRHATACGQKKMSKPIVKAVLFTGGRQASRFSLDGTTHESSATFSVRKEEKMSAWARSFATMLYQDKGAHVLAFAATEGVY
jgi:hypothetical protein